MKKKTAVTFCWREKKMNGPPAVENLKSLVSRSTQNEKPSSSCSFEFWSLYTLPTSLKGTRCSTTSHTMFVSRCIFGSRAYNLFEIWSDWLRLGGRVALIGLELELVIFISYTAVCVSTIFSNIWWAILVCRSTAVCVWIHCLCVRIAILSIRYLLIVARGGWLLIAFRA